MRWKMKKNNKTIVRGAGLVNLMEENSIVAEQYRMIRNNVQFSTTADNQLKVIEVTSAGAGEGKSNTAINLAVTFAMAGHKTLIIDADLRKPTLHRTLNLSNEKGLSIFLVESESLEMLTQNTNIEGLTALTSGPKPPAPSVLLDSERMDQLIEISKEKFDVVIVDTPPIMPVADSQILASKVDGTILVVREKITNKDQLIRTKELLAHIDANVLGVVYRQSNDSKEAGYYYYY